MNKERMREPWQVAELNRYLAANRNDPCLKSRPVFLSNPADRTELDNVLRRYLWPAVVAALSGTSLSASGMGDGFSGTEIEDARGECTTRTLTFVLSDAKRPLLPGVGPPWFYRGRIECSTSGFMISSDFYLHLTDTFGFRRVRRLLTDPMFAGNPPGLNIESGIDGEETWIVAFTEGSGRGWNVVYPQPAVSHVREKVEKTVAVIEAAYGLERDQWSAAAFRALRKRLHEAYASY